MHIQHTSVLLGLPDMRVLHLCEATDGSWLVWVQGVASGAICPRCSTYTERVHQRRSQAVDDLPAHGHPVVLVLIRRRWRCGHCDHVFAETLPSVARYQRMTLRYQQALFQGLCKRPVKAVSNEVGLGFGRMQRLLERMGDEVLATREIQSPRLVGVDEFAARKGRIYNTAFVDLELRRIIDVVETRSGIPVEAFLRRHCAHAEAVVIDLREPYRSAIRNALPDAKIVADKFHVIRLAQMALNDVRHRIRKKIKGDRSHGIWRKRWVLLRNYEDVPPDERHHLRALLDLSEDLKQAYGAKEALRQWYRTSTPENAVCRLNHLLLRWFISSAPELRRMARSLVHWRTEVCNYVTYRISNSVTEGLNNKIKVVKRQGYGFRSFRNFRRRILLA